MKRELVLPEERSDGEETHPSWLRVRASRIQATPGQHLFDSEIAHREFVRVTVERCSRKRDLQRDWFYNYQPVIEFDLSQAQWGAFVSSFGDGSGVPATLNFLLGEGEIPAAPFESRLAESHAETKEAAQRAFESVKAAQEKLSEAFERGAGKREMRELIRGLEIVIGNAPKNVDFAAQSLSEHSENVVAKARADIEGMVLGALLDHRATELESAAVLGELEAPGA